MMGNWEKWLSVSFVTIITLCVMIGPAMCQQGMKPISPRGNKGAGPYNKLVIWGGLVIDGTGAPPKGPMNIVVKGNKIVSIRRADVNQHPEADHVIDARGMYITPGFIDVHDHLGGAKIDFNASYAYKLWLGHGITTVRGVPFIYGNLDWELNQRELSAKNKIVAPRLVVCAIPGSGKEWRGRSIDTPEDVVAWVHYAKKEGVDCLGEFANYDPAVYAAEVAVADSLGLETINHIPQEAVVRMTAADAVKAGLDEVTHFYGIFESILKDHSLQNYGVDYNYNNEYDRFGRVAQLAKQSYPPGSKPWNDLIDLFLKHHTILSPTFSIYSAGRNVMSARNADWMFRYILPSLWNYLKPNPKSHGSYFYNWTSRDEAAWHRFFNKWMQFVYDYNNAGGRITIGDDTAFIYELFGFGYVKEMKMLEEAGLTPLEVIRSATLYGAESIFEPHESTGEPIKYGIIRPGKLADLLVFTHNPLNDFNMIYGTGALRLDKETGKAHRVRALKYTIKDGIIYDSQKLLNDVRKMVKEAKQRTGFNEKYPLFPMFLNYPVNDMGYDK